MNENLKGVKIVWVEDDKFLGNMIAKRLEPTGATLIQITDGAKAYQAIKDNRPQVVMLDLLLPNVDGFEILRQIKADPETKPIPVLVLSNLGQQSEVDKVKALGAVKFMVKAAVGLDEIIPEIAKVVKPVVQ